MQSVLRQRRQSLEEERQRVAEAGASLSREVGDLAQKLGGETVAERFEDIAIEDAGVQEARLGPLVNAIVVDDPQRCARTAGRSSRPARVGLADKTQSDRRPNAYGKTRRRTHRQRRDRPKQRRRVAYHRHPRAPGARAQGPGAQARSAQTRGGSGRERSQAARDATRRSRGRARYARRPATGRLSNSIARGAN